MNASPPAEMSPRAPTPRLNPKAQGRYLWGEWKSMFRPQTIAADALAGVAVALVALPLSLAIANASGVPPKVGLVTAIVGGIAVALFGGCRLQVSGPAAAMTFLVSEIISKYNRIGEEEGLGPGYGLTMLVSATMLAGLFQLLAGYFRIGRFMQFIPRPVVAGFLSGIGVTILCTQLPKILGYDAPHDEEGGALGLLWSTLRHVDLTEWTSLAVGLTSAGLMVLTPKISRKLPTPLIAVATATALPLLMRWPEVATLGKLPTGFPVPHVPTVPWMFWNEMFMAALTIFFLASIESLLSASVVDSMVRQTRVDNDQELVGQGLGNVASALFGGIPVTGVIARSATNIQAGARTRLSAILHALMILAVMLVLGPLAERIPIPALAGVLCVVAVRMVEVHMIRALWRGSRAELAVYVLTAGAILVTDLIVGVPVGMIAAFFYVVYEMSTLEIRVLPSELPTDGQVAPEVGPECPEVRVLALEGPLFFASGFHLRNMLSKINGFRALVLDMTQVPFLDVTGAEILEEGVELMRRRGVVVVLCSDSSATRQRLRVLAEAQFAILRECPIAKDRTEALALAASHLSGDALCRECQPLGHCRVRTSADPSQSSYRGSGAA